MKKTKATVLLTIVLVLTAILTVLSFARFPVGTKDFNGFLGAIQTDYDVSGGTAYTLKLAKENTETVKDINEVINTLKNRLDLLGYDNYSVKALKDVDEAVEDYDIRIVARGRVNQYGEVDTDTLKSDIGVVATYGELKFYGGDSENPTTEILQDKKVIADAYYAGASADGSSYQVAIKFTDDAYSELIKQIKDNSSYYLEIKLGDTVLLSGSSALSESYFNDKTIAITSSSEAMAKQFALQIKTGGLAYNYEVGDGVDFIPAFGQDTELKCVIALAIILVAVIVATFVLNKKFGLVFCLSAILFVDLYLFLLIAIPVIKVSLGGILGFALAIFFLADGFIITSKYIKDEFARGKTVKSAVKTGLFRALAPVLGSSGIAVACSLILFALSFGAVKNFAVIFGIGATLSAITSVLFVRMFASLILTLADYKENFLGLKRGDDVAEEKGE